MTKLQNIQPLGNDRNNVHYCDLLGCTLDQFYVEFQRKLTVHLTPRSRREMSSFNRETITRLFILLCNRPHVCFVAVCRERDELLALLDVKERLKYEQTRVQGQPEDAYSSFTCNEVRING